VISDTIPWSGIVYIGTGLTFHSNPTSGTDGMLPTQLSASVRVFLKFLECDSCMTHPASTAHVEQVASVRDVL
jgi:hypothetical protein